MKQNTEFLNLLIINNIINTEQNNELKSTYGNDSFKILTHLIKENPTKKQVLAKLWGDSTKTAYVNLAKINLYPEIVEKIPKDFAYNFNVIGLSEFGGVITVASSNPDNVFITDNLEKILGMQVSIVFSLPDEIEKNLKKFYLNEKNTKQNINEENEKEQLPSVISPKTQEYLVENVSQLMRDSENDKIPDKQICYNVERKINAEVSEKMEIIQCINQLRIADEHAYSHAINVSTLSMVLCKELGLSPNLTIEISIGGLLHDIGKIRIPKYLRYKTKDFKPEELTIVKRHPELGYQIAQRMKFQDVICNIIKDHHERKNGKGYPSGKTNEKLSIGTKIISIIDAYENLVADRPYIKGLSKEKAINILLLEGNTIFDSDLLFKFAQLAYKQDLKTSSVR